MKRLYFASLHKCNQRCIFCVRLGKNKTIKYINTQDSIEILTRKKREGFEHILFDGGEPFFRDDLATLINHCIKVNYKDINVLTNGTLLKERARGVLAEIDKRDISKVSFSVSLHSHKAEIADKITKMRGGFKLTTEGIRELFKLGVKNISIFTVINCYNFHLLEEFVIHVDKQFPEIKAITFSFIYPAGEAENNHKIYPKLSDVEPFLLKALDRCEKRGIRFSLTTCGTVPLCFLRKYKDVLIKQQELDQPDRVGIVDSNNETGFQLATKEYHLKSKIKSDLCKDCYLNDQCGGVWKFYAEKYGVNELRPVRNGQKIKKIKEENLLLLTGYSCNNNCIFCSNKAKRDKDYATSKIEEELEAGYKKGFRSVEFLGGEPSIRKDIFHLIDRAKSIGFSSIKLTTNGRIFCYPQMAKKFKESGITDLAISVHGSNARTHQALTRTPGSFEQSLEGLRNCLSIGFDSVSVNTVVTKLNIGDLSAMSLLFEKLGLEEWHLLELLPDGNGEKAFSKLTINPFDLAKNLETIKTFKGTLILFDFPCCVIGEKKLNSNNVIYVGVLEKGLFLKQKACDAKDDCLRIKKKENNLLSEVMFDDKYKTKMQSCNNCSHSNVCGGFTKEYFEIYRNNKVNRFIEKFLKNEEKLQKKPS